MSTLFKLRKIFLGGTVPSQCIMHTGELYLPGDEDIIKEQVIYQDKLCEYNLTKPSETEKRAAMLIALSL